MLIFTRCKQQYTPYLDIDQMSEVWGIREIMFVTISNLGGQ